MHFSFPSCLIVARTSSTTFNKKVESGHLSLFPHLKGNACSFCLLSMKLRVDFSYMAFIIFSYVPFISTLLRVFIISGCWILLNAFSASIDMIMWFLSFIYFYVVDDIYWFVNVVPTLHSWNKYHLTMVYDIFDALLYLVC